MSKDFSNSKQKQNFLSSIPRVFLKDSNICNRSKFNFSYFDINHPGQDFVDWNDTDGNSKLVKLINKLKEFTRESLLHWEEEKIGSAKKRGGRQSVLEIYKEFPKSSAFRHPPHVPEDVWWGRFRIDNSTRLAGFVIPKELNGNSEYDCNTFYVVFLDKNHQFYITQP